MNMAALYCGPNREEDNYIATLIIISGQVYLNVSWHLQVL